MKYIFITGVNRGIGFFLTKELLKRGHSIIGTYRKASDNNNLQKLKSAFPKTLNLTCLDVKAIEEDELTRYLNSFKAIDILINNAGFSSKIRSARHIGAEEWQSVMDVNTLGPVILTKSLLPGMIKQQRGDVIMISSLAGLRPNVMAGAAYSAAKAAARAYMEVLSSEVRRHGIRCTTIFPGEVDTPILDNRALPPDADARATMMKAEDISAVVMTALQLPHRATVLELSIGATEPRDMSADIKAALDKEQH